MREDATIAQLTSPTRRLDLRMRHVPKSVWGSSSCDAKFTMYTYIHLGNVVEMKKVFRKLQVSEYLVSLGS